MSDSNQIPTNDDAAQPASTVPATVVAETQLEYAQRLLGTFLRENPPAKLEEIVAPENGIAITLAWSDPSFIILLPEDVTAFADAVTHLYLPPRLTAIWHRDTKDLEVIWTAFKLAEKAAEVWGRKFEFTIGGKTHKCEFGKSSDRLLILAKGTRPIAGTDTQYRNLQSFSMYAMLTPEDRVQEDARRVIDKPTSFWVRDIEWEDDAVIELGRNLNFTCQFSVVLFCCF